jgi:kanamycin kinase
VEVPEELCYRYDGWSWTPVWASAPDARTWRADHPDGRRHFVKVAASGRYPSLGDEAARARWSAAHLPVPPVVGHGRDGPVEWLVTAGMAGHDATRHALRAEPERLVPELAAGLRRFHEAPTAACPFDFTLDTAAAHVRRRVAGGLVDPARDFHDEHAHLDPRAALALLERLRPDTQDPVVCHGDYCLPNVLLDDDGRVSGFLDLGELGVADRWWDLAVGSWSVTWNLGSGWEKVFFDAYGIEPDERRITFYRLLYDLAS